MKQANEVKVWRSAPRAKRRTALGRKQENVLFGLMDVCLINSSVRAQAAPWRDDGEDNRSDPNKYPRSLQGGYAQQMKYAHKENATASV